MHENKELDSLLTAIFEPVAQAERILRIANYEASRTDPWVLYCRHCGNLGEFDTDHERSIAAKNHLLNGHHAQEMKIATASHGRLLHIWTYS